MHFQRMFFFSVLTVSVQLSLLPGASTKAIIEKETDITSDNDISLISLFKRDDGASGDGDCDPCLASCSNNIVKRSSDDEPEPVELRILHGNASETEPWLDGEVARWHLIERQPPTLSFNCDAIPNVCQNMCYGVNCKGFPRALTISKASGLCQAARRRNSCGSTNPNRCSTRFTPAFAPGNSCDEYPFASTLQGQQAALNAAATRCVPAGENRSQGGSISAFYRNLPDGTAFTVSFTGAAASTGFCAANTNCVVAAGSSQQ
ncbi:uncharacterized protein STEHIDRAFT_111607 [Stereum hirsutum FP-91666 SS1]|uniref:uncharacterized protein n=1 Tax=Stereum hirsutum (strain FP-91666) TaxID=721885 RepID=UPI0004449C17|nr:uncharacterized protein STEHIDRAFT_111607 [Stereum hirsutum FP-91666 SS1]EIM86063.1 hypothetical protein STEHIDRAFT_111607 [Stereum hirsutum FP-91666 SS1]